MQPEEQSPTPVHLAVSGANDGVLKGLLALLAVLLIVLMWRGVTVRLVVRGDGSSTVPLHVAGVSGGSDGNFALQTVTRDNGAVYVTRMNKHTGELQVFFLDDQGNLQPVAQQ